MYHSSRGNKRRKLRFSVQTNALWSVEPLFCAQPWCWKSSPECKQKYFVSQNPGAVPDVRAAHGLPSFAGRRCQAGGWRASAPSLAPACATAPSSLVLLHRLRYRFGGKTGFESHICAATLSNSIGCCGIVTLLGA